MIKILIKLVSVILMFLSISVGCGGSKGKEPPVVRRQKYLGNIRVEVLNGTHVRGLGKKVTIALREMGFDVRYYGNASQKQPKTFIIDHVDPKLSRAKTLGGAIGCRKMSYEPDPDSLFDVTLVLGMDYNKYFKNASHKNFIY